VWSADFPADDWRHVSPDRVYQLAIQRLEAKGKGILLLHDIQPRTVAALPKIIRDLKARGYRIVNVVPATADRPVTPTETVEWLLHPPTETAPIARWPKVPAFVFASTEMLPAPALADLNAQTPQQSSLPVRATALANAAPLPVPGRDVFEVKETLAVLMATPFRRSTTVARVIPGKSGSGSYALSASAKVRTKGEAAVLSRSPHAHTASKRSARVGHADGKNGTTSGTAQRPTRLASLKKR
jgi:hypothetical protein